MKKGIEVLVVDDIIDAAKDFAELIESNLEIRADATSSPETALEIVKNNNIKVVVLDQVMPNMKGTDLFKKIKQINPFVKALMLTGEAKSDEVGLAFNLGFSDYLNKLDILQLPQKVLILYNKYDIDILKGKSYNKPITLYHDFKHFMCIKYELINIIPNKDLVYQDEEYEVVLDIIAGQDIANTTRYEFENTIKIESSIEDRMKSEMNISDIGIKKIKANINAELISKYNKTTTFISRFTNVSEQKFRLPEQPTDLSVKYITRRVIERSPIYKEFCIVIKKSCLLCKESKIFTIIVSKQTDKFHTRQTDYFSDNTKSTIDLGVHRLKE